MFSALAVQYDMYELLSDMHEAAFIEKYAAVPIIGWFMGWDNALTEQIKEFPLSKTGALVTLEDGLNYSLTDECLDLYDSTESDMFKALEEKQVYRMMRELSQEDYIAFRRFIVEHPICSEKDIRRFKMKYKDPAIWEILSSAYEIIPKDSYRCPSCGWTMRFHGINAVCCNHSCSENLPDRSQLELLDTEKYEYRLLHGVMRYISLPGKLELEIMKKAEQLGCKTTLWPEMDKYDIRLTLPNGDILAVDAKTHRNPYILANDIKNDSAFFQTPAKRKLYVVPYKLLNERADYCDICNTALKGRNAECITDKKLYQLLRKETCANEKNLSFEKYYKSTSEF